MTLHKKDQGSIGEALVVAQILENKHNAFVDFGDNSKIDVICEDANGQLHRIQVKTVGREKRYPFCSLLYLYKNGPNYAFKYEEHMVDWFALVDMKTKKIAWVSSAEAHQDNKSQLVLRHKILTVKQKNTRMFDDYINYPI